MSAANSTKGTRVPKDDLKDRIDAELLWDPKVDSTAIAVLVDDGVVTLRGTVGSFREKREARQDAKRVHGVKAVKNELEVRILNANRRTDAELRGAVLQALMLDSTVPATIDANVTDGFVTLTGSAHWKFEEDEAERVVGNVAGVRGVINDVVVTPPGPTVREVEHDIKKAMERNAKLDAESVEVKSEDGTITLRGTVSSWADHDEAVAAAWAAPGVRRVKDRIVVLY